MSISFLKALKARPPFPVGGWTIDNASINKVTRSFIWLGCCVALASCSINTQSISDAGRLIVANAEAPICVEDETEDPSCPEVDPLPGGQSGGPRVYQSGTPIIAQESNLYTVPIEVSFGSGNYLNLGLVITYNDPISGPSAGSQEHWVLNVDGLNPYDLQSFEQEMAILGGTMAQGGISYRNKSQSAIIVTFSR